MHSFNNQKSTIHLNSNYRLFFNQGEIFSSAEVWHVFKQMQVWHPSNSSVYLYQLLVLSNFLFHMAAQDIHHVLFWQGEVEEPFI